MSIYCASGCSVSDKHLPDCSEDVCFGCVPKLAVEGTLCRRCASRLLTALVDVPALRRHLRLLAEPSLSSPLGKQGGASSMPAGWRSLYPDEIDFLDQVGAVLGSWFINVNEERGFPWGDNPREWPGWLWLEEDTCGVPVPWSLSDAALELVVERLVPLHEWMCAQPWAVDFMEELATLVHIGWMQWPEIERSRRVPLPCPKCDSMALEYRPPAFMTAPAVVTCVMEDCGASWTDGEWMGFVQAALDGAGVKS